MNFVIRTITAVVYATIMLFCILKGGPWFVGLFALCTILTTLEYTGLANKYKGANVSRLWATVAAFTFYAAIVGLSVMQSSAILFLPFIFTLIVLMVRELYYKKPSPINDWAYTLFPVIYIALPYALTSMLAFDAQGPGTGYSPVIPLTLFVFLWCNDVGAYCTGCTIGKHKLFERISPKKTWEGSIEQQQLCQAVMRIKSQNVLSKAQLCNAGDPSLISESGRSPGEGNGNPL